MGTTRADRCRDMSRGAVFCDVEQVQALTVEAFFFSIANGTLMFLRHILSWTIMFCRWAGAPSGESECSI